MKEKLFTIPLNDAVNADDECPFCYIERKLEQDILDFVLGSCASYMEADVRDMTDKAGFCRAHFKKMFDYGNTLGNAWILKTHYMRLINEMDENFKSFKPSKTSLKDKLRKKVENSNSIVTWLDEKKKSCYICDQFKDNYSRYMSTFFYLYKHDENFYAKINEGKGFCLPHFKDLCYFADIELADKDKESFYEKILPLQKANMERLFDDVSWMVEKFDYRNKDADWKNSKDSIQRGMQKLKGGYPADSIYKANN